MAKTRCVFLNFLLLQKATFQCKLCNFEIENGCMVFFPRVASTEDSIIISFVSSKVLPNVNEFVSSGVFRKPFHLLTLSNIFIKCSF